MPIWWRFIQQFGRQTAKQTDLQVPDEKNPPSEGGYFCTPNDCSKKYKLAPQKCHKSQVLTAVLYLYMRPQASRTTRDPGCVGGGE